MSNQNTEKSPGIDFALFSRTCEMGMNNFGYLNIYIQIYILQFQIIGWVLIKKGGGFDR